MKIKHSFFIPNIVVLIQTTTQVVCLMIRVRHDQPINYLII